MRIEDEIKRKGLELGFTHVGIAPVRDYEELWAEIVSRPEYKVFSDGEESLLYKACHTKTLHPEKRSVVCATFGYSGVDFPEELGRHVAVTYMSRKYTPPEDMRYGAVIGAFMDFLEDAGLHPDRSQFTVPQRLACAEAGIVTYGRNNFAYTPEDGSFNILVTALVEAGLECDEPTVRCDCPPYCDICRKACPTQAIMEPCRLDPLRCILFNQQRFEPGAQEGVWAKMGERIHGCDECQLACPRNREVLAAPRERDLYLDMLDSEFDLEKVLLLDQGYYDSVVRPIMYNYIRNLDIFRRNAAVALGNTGDSSHLPALREVLSVTQDHNVRKAVCWAIGRLEANDGQ